MDWTLLGNAGGAASDRATGERQKLACLMGRKARHSGSSGGAERRNDDDDDDANADDSAGH